MKMRFICYILLIFLLSSCNLPGITSQDEEEDTPSGGSVKPFVPEGDVPSAPVLAGEEIACTHYVSQDGDDGGANWVRLDGLPALARPRSIAIHPSQTEIIFVGTEFGSLYRSQDGGNTWEPIAAGLPPEAAITSIVFNPTDSNQIFLGDHFSGVYLSNDGGQIWFAATDGLRTRAINELALSSEGLHLYAATESEGVYRLDLDGQPPESPSPLPAQPGSPPQEEPAAPAEPDSPPDETHQEPTTSLPCLGGFLTLALIWYDLGI